MDCTNEFRRNQVLSMNSKLNTTSSPTENVKFARVWMPRCSPSEMETVANTVMTQTSQIWFSAVFLKEPSSFPSPAAMASTPKPKLVQTPKVVHAMDSASMKSPSGEYTRWPRSG